MGQTHVRRASSVCGRRSFMTGLLFSGLLGRRAHADFLAGETLRLLVATGPGSADDTMNRLFARHLAGHLPGTSVQPETMPKANAPLMACRLWDAEADGLTLGFPSQGLLFGALRGDDAMPFDYLRFQWIGSLAEESRVLLVSESSGIRTLEDLLSHGPLLAAASSVNSSHYYEALILNAVLGSRIKSIPGYTGSGRSMAVIGGEVEAFIGSLESASTIAEAGAGRVVLRLAGPLLPPPYDQVPLLSDLPIDADRGWAVELMEAEARIGRVLAGPPSLPADRLRRLRWAFQETATDPAFIAEAATLGLQVAAIPGDEIQGRLDELLPYGADGGKAFKALLACGERRAEGKSC